MRKPSGVATLAVMGGLLLIISIAVLYLNRQAVTDIRSTGVGAARHAAQEAAEAGLVWASQRLNAATGIGRDCAPASGATSSFRRLYVQPAGRDTPVAPASAFPGCKLRAQGLSCSCPDPAGAERRSTASGPEAAFSLVFSAVTDAAGVVVPDAVRVTATGCSAHAGSCPPGQRPGGKGPDAVSQASAVFKLHPLLIARPAAALTCAGRCVIGSGFRLQNRDTATNGLIANAGGDVSGCSTESGSVQGNCRRLQGTPLGEALKPSDLALSGIASSDSSCAAGALMRRYFTQPLDELRDTPMVLPLGPCATSGACAAPMKEALEAGVRVFHLPGEFRLDAGVGSTIGSALDPVVLIAEGPLTISGGVVVHGLVFMQKPNAENLQIDNATVNGAVVSCGSTNLSRSGLIDYHTATMTSLVKSNKYFRRVAGSWTDLCQASASGTVTCR